MKLKIFIMGVLFFAAVGMVGFGLTLLIVSVVY